MHNIGDYPPQTDILTHSKGGYGGRGPHIGGCTPCQRGGVRYIYLFPLPYELSTSYKLWIHCWHNGSRIYPRPWVWITCGEIYMTMFGGVIYYDDLYVLGVLSYGWIRGRGESSLGRVDSNTTIQNNLL